MSNLTPLRRQLASLKRKRSSARMLSALAAVVAAILLALLLLFVLDVVFHLAVVQRLLVMALLLAGVMWAWRTYSSPELQVRESSTDMALMVERQHGMSSDLVAALQFEEAGVGRTGSEKLEQAVVDQAGERSQRLNVYEGLSRGRMFKRVLLVLAIILLLAAIAWMLPAHARVFIDRLCFGTQHYPTDTVIERIVVNEHVVLNQEQQEGNHLAPVNMKAPQAQAVRFAAICRGECPEEGQVELETVGSGHRRLVSLTKLADDDPLAVRQLETLEEAPADAAVYVGELPRLVSSLDYGLTLGDAWTDPARVDMISLPVVEVTRTVIPPDYAKIASVSDDSAGREGAVLEGSAVRYSLKTVNDKQLKKAWMHFTTGGTTEVVELMPMGRDGTQWQLQSELPALDNVQSPATISFQVIDEDDLQLESPVHKTIRLKPDRKPLASAEVAHRVVLPTAKPRIDFHVNDDFGVASIAIELQVERGEVSMRHRDSDSSASESSADEGNADESDTDEADADRNLLSVHSAEPILADALPHQGQYPLDLTPFRLVKGDQIRLTLSVTDYRGDQPGETYYAAPVTLEISDENGVLAAISEADEQSDERLTDIIKKQLGIGESP